MSRDGTGVGSDYGFGNNEQFIQIDKEKVKIKEYIRNKCGIWMGIRIKLFGNNHIDIFEDGAHFLDDGGVIEPEAQLPIHTPARQDSGVLRNGPHLFEVEGREVLEEGKGDPSSLLGSHSCSGSTA